MWVLGHFLRMVSPIHGKKANFHVGQNAQVGMPQKINLTIEFDKFYIKMQERGKGIYMDQTGRDSTG